MTSLIKKPLFWTNVVSISITGLMVAGLAFAWTNPSATPPGGSGAITATSDGKVGVGTASPTQKLDVNGYLVARTGDCIATDDTLVPPPASSLPAASSGSAETTVRGAAVTGSSVAASIPRTTTTGSVTSVAYDPTRSGPAFTTISAPSGSSLVGSTLRPAVAATLSEPYKLKGCRKTWPAAGVGVADSGALPSFDSVGIVTKNRLAKFVSDVPGKETIGDSNIVDDNKTVYVTGDFAFTGKLMNGSVPWYRITNIPKIDCGKGAVLQSINPTVCVSYTTITDCTPGPFGGGGCSAGGGVPTSPSGPTTCTSSIPATGPGPTTGTAICGLTCPGGAPHITSYTGAGEATVGSGPPSYAPPDYVCSGKSTLGPSSITCSC